YWTSNHALFAATGRDQLKTRLANHVQNIRNNIGQDNFVIVHRAELAKPNLDFTSGCRNPQPIAGECAAEKADSADPVDMPSNKNFVSALEVGERFAQRFKKLLGQRVRAHQVVDGMRSMPDDVRMHAGLDNAR